MCTRRSGTRLYLVRFCSSKSCNSGTRCCGVRVGNGTYAYRRYGGTACFGGV